MKGLVRDGTRWPCRRGDPSAGVRSTQLLAGGQVGGGKKSCIFIRNGRSALDDYVTSGAKRSNGSGSFLAPRRRALPTAYCMERSKRVWTRLSGSTPNLRIWLRAQSQTWYSSSQRT